MANTQLKVDHELTADLGSIGSSIRAVSKYLLEVEASMRTLEQAGMYPQIPTERWKDETYLYMYFSDRLSATRRDASAHGLTLDSKGRLYIGRDPVKIEEARRLAENRRRWGALEVWQKNCYGWLRRIRSDVARLAREATLTPNLDAATLELYGPALGTGPAIAAGAAGPNGLGTDIGAAVKPGGPNGAAI